MTTETTIIVGATNRLRARRDNCDRIYHRNRRPGHGLNRDSVLAVRIGTYAKARHVGPDLFVAQSFSVRDRQLGPHADSTDWSPPAPRHFSDSPLHACALSSPAFFAELAAGQPVGTT
jgi:hypothetical protein